MKKIFFGILAIVAMVATSCQQETDLVVNGGAATVSFQIEAPQMSRAFSDGSTATVLQYAVYEGTNELTDLTVGEDNAKVINGSTTVELQLVTGNTYTVIFWADNANAPYTVDWATGTLTVDYSNVLSNNEELDAFYAKHAFTVKGAQTETVYLKRPFSQVNIGTSDYAAAKSSGYEPKYSYVKVSNIYNTLNLWDGAVSNEAEVTYKYADIPSGETFPVAGHEYLAMNYLLMAADEQTIDVEFGYGESSTAAEKTRTVGSVPVRRNYRTNIYGQLLTSDVDINVEIKPAYDDAFNNAHDYYVEGDVYYLTSLDGFKWFADQVDGGNTFEGKTVVLDTDIDLSGVTRANGVWTPIGGIEGSHYTINFRGVFDGAGHSVKNFSVNHHQAAGLFGYMVGGTIKNLTVENATFTSNHYAGAIVAWIEQGGKPVVIENCHVKNVTLTSTPELVNGVYDNGDKVGALVGFAHGGEYKNNTVENATVKGYRDLGGLVGYLNKGVVSGNTIKNVTVTQDLTNGYKTDIPTTLGAVVGRYGADNTVEDNTVENTNVATLVNNQTELEAALKGGLKSVLLADGNYDLSGLNINGATIVGASKNVVVKPHPCTYNGVKGITEVAFKNLTITVPENNMYCGLQGAKESYKDCVINGQYWLYSENTTFEECVFNTTDANNYNVWTYGAANTTFNKCVFNSAGKSVLIYKESLSANYNVTFNECTLNASAPVDGKAAIEIDSSFPYGGGGSYTVAINTTTANGFANGNVSGNSLWNQKKGNNSNITVDGEVVHVAGSQIVETADALVEALENGDGVYLTDDVKIEPAGMSNAYGTTGINVKNGQTIDGNGHTLDIKGAGGTWDSGISTTGGLIKNIKVTGSFRGIFINHNSDHAEKVVLENVIIDGTTYTISCDQGTGNGLDAYNSTFKGWTSYAATLGNAKFVECYFGRGNGYSYCRPYSPTEFINCQFEEGYTMDPRANVVLENCTLNGVAVTADNLADLVTNVANVTLR